MDKLIKNNKTQIVQIAYKHKATKVHLFGSRLRNDARDNSDLDLLIDINNDASIFDLIHLKSELEDLLNIKVDIATRNSLSPHIKENIEKDLLPL